MPKACIHDNGEDCCVAEEEPHCICRLSAFILSNGSSLALFVGGVMTFINQYIDLLGWLGEKMTDNEKRFIKSIFSGDSSGHDYYHTIRV